MPGSRCFVQWEIKGKRRGVAFLIHPDLRSVNAQDHFNKLDADERAVLKARFQAWIDGINQPKYFHGWDKSQFGGRYTNCFVFKKPPHRYYGFLFHPQDDRSYQMCVLAIHATKHQWETDVSELKRVAELSERTDVHGALERLSL